MTMQALDAARGVGLSGPALDVLMPMHICADPQGCVARAGPTLIKMAGRGGLVGLSLFDLLDIRRPARVSTMPGLRALCGQRLGLTLCRRPDLPLRGVVMGLPDQAGVILDLSLGLSFARAVAEFGLRLNDFSPCDQTLDLLYLHEANRSTMALSRHLSQRLQAARATAEAQALTDPLTGLANRRAMDIAITRALDDPVGDVTVMQIDLDHFKSVNDGFGHAAGDAVLERVGRVLRQHLRRGDVAGRVGGDEFLVLLRDSDDLIDPAPVAARLIAQIERPIPFRGHVCRISASIGIAARASYGERPGVDRLLADADAALYAAKRAGRGRFMLHKPDTARAQRRAGDPPPAGPSHRLPDPGDCACGTGG